MEIRELAPKMETHVVGAWVGGWMVGGRDRWSLLNATCKFHKSRPGFGYVDVTDELREVSGHHMAVVWEMTNG